MTRLTIKDLLTRERDPTHPSRSRRASGREPNASRFRLHFVIAGAPRCGTTWLCENLNDHPDITCFRETTYFNDRRVHRRYDRGNVVSWFRGRGPGPLYGSSEPGVWNCRAAELFDDPSYDYQPLADSVEVLKTFDPMVNIVVSLRDPVERALSYLLSGWNNFRRLGFTAGIQTAEQALFEKLPYRHRQQILTGGKYLRHLKRFRQTFDRIQILIFERDVQQRPREGLGRVLRFVGEGTSHEIARGYRFPRADTVINQAPREDRGELPQVTPRCRRRLEQYYRESKQALYEHIPEAREWWT